MPLPPGIAGLSFFGRRLLRSTRSRTYAHRHLAVLGVCRTGIRFFGTEDPRCYLVKQLHGRAEDIDTKRIPADPNGSGYATMQSKLGFLKKNSAMDVGHAGVSANSQLTLRGGSLTEAGQCCGEHRYWRSLS